MTIRMLHSFNGTESGRIVTLAGAEETRLVGLGLATYAIYGDIPKEYSVIPKEGTSEAIQDAHDEALARGLVLDFAGATYRITTPVSLQPNRVHMLGNDCNFDCTGMTDTYAIILESKSPSPQFNAKSRSFSNFNIYGPGQLTATTGIVHGGSSAGRSARPTIYNANIYDFGVGYDMINYAYLNQFYSTEIRNCGTGLRQSLGSDAGEGTGFYGGAIYNCETQCVHTLDDSSELMFFGTSFDYTPKMFLHTQGRIVLNSCHIENRGTDWVDDVIDVNGDGVDFVMHGGFIVSAESQPSTLNQFVNVRHSNSRAYFDGVTIHNLSNGSTNKFGTGPGIIKARNSKFYANGMNVNPTRITDAYSLLLDGLFEASTFPRDFWTFLTDSAGTATNRVTATNGTLTQSSAVAYAGTKSLRVNKTATGNLTFIALVPIDKQSGPVTGQFRHTAVAGTPLTGAATTYEHGWTVHTGNDSNTIPILGVFSSTGSATFTPTVGTWNNINVRVGVHPPSWATHAYVRFTTPSAQTGDFHIDDFSLHQW